LSAEQVTKYPAPLLSYIVRPLAAGHRLDEGMVDCALVELSTAARPIKNVMPIMAEWGLGMLVIISPGGRHGYIAADMRLSCQ
jgi:hypothetical protein